MARFQAVDLGDIDASKKKAVTRAQQDVGNNRIMDNRPTRHNASP